jgi:hypothetical protein
MMLGGKRGGIEEVDKGERRPKMEESPPSPHLTPQPTTRAPKPKVNASASTSEPVARRRDQAQFNQGDPITAGFRMELCFP